MGDEADCDCSSVAIYTVVIIDYANKYLYMVDKAEKMDITTGIS